jgi:gas vesicle protein
MKYLKYFNQINEGHITLTADEHKAVERVMKKLPEMFKNKLEPLVSPQVKSVGELGERDKFFKNLIDSKSTNIVYVDTIDYTTSSGIKSKVGIYIVNEDVGYKGEYIPGDTNNTEDNIILINQSGFDLEKLSIQDLRTTLIHELIHAKDPKLNQKFTDRVKNTFKKDYYKRRFEFEAFTGQILNIISNSTYKFLKEGWTSKELKEIFDDILEHFKDTKNDFIDAFSKQNPDFIKSITTYKDFGRFKIRGIEYSKIPGIDKYKDGTDLKSNTLMFLNREWDKSKSVDIQEFQKIIYDAFTMGLSEIKKINSDYTEFLKDLYKEIKKQVDFINSKTEEKIELNYKTMSDWMKKCQNITYTSRTKIKKVPS